MIPTREIPISSVTWLLGSVAILILGTKTLIYYRRSRTEFLKYSGWFAMIIGVSLIFFSVPSFFTLNTAVLVKWNMVGEVFYYSSMVVQAAMVWFLILRKYMPVYAVTVPVGLLSLSAWIYALPRARVVAKPNFLDYLDPRYSTFVLGGLLLVLFLPVGIYYLRMVPRQHGAKSVANSLVFGLTYVGTGLTTGIAEIVKGRVITRSSAPGIIAFFVALLVIGLWPRRSAKTMPAAPSADTPVAAGPANQPPLPPYS